MKKIIILALLLCSVNSFSQDILQAILVDRYEIKNKKLDSIIGAFLNAESECLGSNINTVPIMYFDENAIGDTNAITLRSIHARDIDQKMCFGYFRYIKQKVFLYNGLQKTGFFNKVSNSKETLLISQRITFGNYLINDTDTLHFAGPRPYEAQWIVFEKEGKIFRGKEYDLCCNIKEQRRNLKQLIEEEGWRQP